MTLANNLCGAVMCPLYYYHQKHPVNYLLLGIFTVSLAFAVGLTCAFTSGKIHSTVIVIYVHSLLPYVIVFCGTGKVILESVILTSVVVISLTLYTFWAAKRGHDFNFLGPFLFGAVIVLMVFSFIQVSYLFSVFWLLCLLLFVFCLIIRARVYMPADSLSFRKDLGDDLWLFGFHYLLWVHCI